MTLYKHMYMYKENCRLRVVALLIFFDLIKHKL